MLSNSVYACTSLRLEYNCPMALNNPERPKNTPDGFDFPYSHFGDPEKRTHLLRNINEAMGINPQVVVNIGCGYDITPSDAFPNARVIHIDIVPQFVEFLRQSGFEAYLPDETPNLPPANLVINILGPGYSGIGMRDDAIILTTNRVLPQGSEVIGLVDTSDPPQIVTGNEAIRKLWDRNNGNDVHLVAMRLGIEDNP